MLRSYTQDVTFMTPGPVLTRDSSRYFNVLMTVQGLKSVGREVLLTRRHTWRPESRKPKVWKMADNEPVYVIEKALSYHWEILSSS